MKKSAKAALAPPTAARMAEFLDAVRRSRRLHRRWASPPATADEYRAFLGRARDARHAAHFVLTPDGELAGVVNLNEIVRGSFESAYLGYYALAPHAGRGWMRQGLALVLGRAFGAYRLHRVEANIQPENLRSIELVRGLGFRREGLSPRYLKLGGRWRDHERWAITREEWKGGIAARATAR